MDGGVLCLDFANTADWHASPEPEEKLNSYADLVSWGEAAGILSSEDAQHLLHLADNQPVVANAVLRQAITLREAIYRIFSRVAAASSPALGDLGILNAALPDAMSHLQVVALSIGFTWDWTGSLDALDQMLWPVVRSAADLLTSDDLDRVRECADDRGCGFLFIDRSRNRSRRWCSMKSCGNRAKVVRYLERRPD